MNFVDWLIIAVLFLSVLSAAKAGLIVEVFSLAGLIFGLLLASWNYQTLTPWVQGWIHSLAMAEAVSFLIIALGVMILASLAGRFLRWSVKSVGLGWADRIAGAAFGLVKGCALVTVAVMVIAAFAPRATWLRQSRFAPGFLAVARSAAVVAPSHLADRIRSGVEDLRKAQPEWLGPAA